ncbi:hypothetical protein GEMRC1_013686 [Eukaryota sp. GEM-RC1]
MIQMICLLLPTLLSLCFCSRILLSDPVQVEMTLDGVSSTRSLHLVIANVDDNEHPDAILFYSSSDGSTSTHWRYRVFYDFNLGFREWQGRHGFFPIVYYGCSYRYVNYQRLTTFAPTDLDGNGQLDVVQVSAVHCCEHAHFARPCSSSYPYNCWWEYRNHVSLRIRVYRNFNKDGTFTSFETPSRSHFRLSVSVSHGNRNGPEALNAYVEVNQCGGSYPHRLNIMIGH